MKSSEITGVQQTPITSASSRAGASPEQIGLNRLREAVAPVLHQSREVALSPNASFDSAQDCHPHSGVGEFLGQTRYFGQNNRGQLTRVPIPPRNAEEAQQYQWNGYDAYDTNQRLNDTRQQVETLRRSDNGPHDLNPKRGVVVQSLRVGPRNGRGTQMVGSLTYDRNGNVDYERRLGPLGSSQIETYRGNGPQFRYEARREGQMPDRVIETTRNGLIRSSGFSTNAAISKD